MTGLNDSKKRPSVRRAGKTAAEERGGRLNASGADSAEKSGSTLVSRRRFLYGAAGVGAVAALGIGGALYNAASDDGDDHIALDAPLTSLSTLNEFTALENADEAVQLVETYDLPYGSLVWANDDEVAACLLPTETGTPLAQVGLLSLQSGQMETVLKKAVGSDDGFEIYDVRANGNGVVWTEANIMQGVWRIYCATANGLALGDPVLVEEGDDTCDTPTIAVAGKYAFWQVLPKLNENGRIDEPARLMRATLGKNDAESVFESNRRMGTPPYSTGSTVTIAPRVDKSSVYYELTNIDAATGEVLDSLVLPHKVSPIEAGYGDTGFMFSFPDIYDYEGAISNLGTYAPIRKPANGDYDAADWFNFTRTPTAPPAWCNGLLVVKSTYSVCGVDLEAGTYFAIDVEDGADSYGEYLASTGSNSTFVTYTNVDHTPVGKARIYACKVKVFTRSVS